MEISAKILDKMKRGVFYPGHYLGTREELDRLVHPVDMNNVFGVESLQAIECITQKFKSVHTMCGPSNTSFGLPERKFHDGLYQNG